MKRCPTCQTQYTDDTLIYCLQDGSRLADLEQVETPTIAFTETDTVLSRRDSASQMSQETRWRPSEVTRVATTAPPSSGSKTAIAVTATVVVMLLVFGVIGIGAWLYLRNVRSDAANLNGGTKASQVNASNAIVTVHTDPTPIPTTKPPANLLPENTNTAGNQSVDIEQIRKDVSQRLYSWKSLAESRNLDEYMSYYADTVDYYRKGRASREFVRSDKQRAFSTFDSISINVSNMSITTDQSGETATAQFDKEWVFIGAHRSAGKVRSQIQWAKINDNWLITGEKDLKVYYTQ